jgi:hypothetical protein
MDPRRLKKALLGRLVYARLTSVKNSADDLRPVNTGSPVCKFCPLIEFALYTSSARGFDAATRRLAIKPRLSGKKL